ncbi:MAG: M6 family metalloprotease-like protein [Rhodothermales bacterium]|jgi:M6 family metalloprotease-like protein
MDRWLQRVPSVQKRTFISLLILLSSLFISASTMAMPAYPEAVTTNQPDGSEIVIRGFGDEHFHWLEDSNGFTVVEQNGWYQYAALDFNGRLTSTGLNVGSADPVANGLAQRILPSTAIQAQSRLDTQSSISLVPAFGNVKNLVILVRFSNHVSRTQPPEVGVEVLMNAASPDATYAPTGSLKAVYLENSYGQMTLDSTVADWFTVNNTETYFANGNSGLTTLLHDALRQALIDADSYIDFGQFDGDNDGFIDSITFLHSGYGAEWSGNDVFGTPSANRIWSHKWSISPWTSSDQNGNGVNVKVSEYHISPAVWGTSGSAIGRVGVIAHETGHFFGLPDLYDTDGSGFGIGSWGLMANSWDFNFTQYCPPHFSPWSKTNLGWYTPTVISDPGIYTLNQAETNPEVYKIQTGFPTNEYLLIENRQNAGFDCTIPQGGLVIWHIDDATGDNNEGYPGQSGWPGNGNHYRVAVLQADGAYNLEHDNNRGDAGDVHHATGVDAMGPGPGGHPNTDTYQGGTISQTGHVISDISASGPSMTFCLNGCLGLASPSNLTATASGSSTINLSWTDNSGPDETGFTIEHSLDGNDWGFEGSVGANATAYADNSLTAGSTHYYRVQAFNGAEVSGWSNTANDTTADLPPATPASLVATANGENQVDLTWTDSSNNEDGFRIERSLSSGSGFVPLLPSVGADVTTFSDTGLNASTTYYYRVYAFNTLNSPGFAADDARTDDPDPIQRINAYRDSFGSGLVNGTYALTHADDNNPQWIEEQESGGKKKDRTSLLGHFWRFIVPAGDVIRVFANTYATTSDDGDTFDFAWAQDDTNYQPLFNTSELNTDNTEEGTIPNSASGEIWIRVLDTDRVQGNYRDRDRIYIDELYIEVENFGPPTAPDAPSGLSVTSVGFNNIDIVWTDNSNNEDSFLVERSTDGSSDWAQIASTAVNAQSYSDTSLGNSETRHYRVRAHNSVGDSAYSNADSGTTLTPPTPPVDPVIVSAVPNGSSSITVNWTHDFANASGFRIQRSLDNIPANFVTLTAIGLAESFIDSSVNQSTEYFYRVQAYGTGVESGWSGIVSATTTGVTPPTTPTINSAVATSSSSITVNWNDLSGDETNFHIQRSDDGGNNYVNAGTVGADVESWVDNGLEAGTTYFYQVRAFNGANSAWSATASATTDSGPTISLMASGFKTKGVKNFVLTWNPSDSGATNVDIYRDGSTNPIAVAPNTGSYPYSSGLKGSGSHTHQVCLEGTTDCSNIASYSF